MLLKWKFTDLRPLIDHARTSVKWRKNGRQKGKPGLWLIKDEGIYLMSNGIPLLPTIPVPGCVGPTNRVVYAEGYKPPECGHIGGDDFVEVISLDDLDLLMVKGCSELQITVSQDALEVSGIK
jgi:Protein of unknown function (DUF3085)